MSGEMISALAAGSPQATDLYVIVDTTDHAMASSGTNKKVTGAQLQSFLATGVTSFNTRTGAVALTSSDVTTALTYTPVNPANNLSDLSSESSARTNLGLGTSAVTSTGQTVVPISSDLEINVPSSVIGGTNVTIASSQRGNLIRRSNSGTNMVDTLPSGGASFPNGWSVLIKNADPGATYTLNAQSAINAAPSIQISPGQIVQLVSDGTNFDANNFVGTSSAVTSFNTRTGAVTLSSGDVTTALGYTPLRPANNLSDVSSASTSRTNLGLGDLAIYNYGNTLYDLGGGIEVASPYLHVSGPNYTYLASDRGYTLGRDNSYAGALSDILPTAGSSGFEQGYYFIVKNTSGSATDTLTIAPSTGTINGASSIVLNYGDFARIVSDGTNWHAFITTANSIFISSFSGTFSGQLSATATVEYTLIGKLITLAIPQVIGTASSGTGIQLALSSAFLPVNYQFQGGLLVNNNNTYTVGMAAILNGALGANYISFTPGYSNNTNAFTSGQTCGIYPQNISYYLS